MAWHDMTWHNMVWHEMKQQNTMNWNTLKWMNEWMNERMNEPRSVWIDWWTDERMYKGTSTCITHILKHMFNKIKATLRNIRNGWQWQEQNTHGISDWGKNPKKHTHTQRIMIGKHAHTHKTDLSDINKIKLKHTMKYNYIQPHKINNHNDDSKRI